MILKRRRRPGLNCARAFGAFVEVARKVQSLSYQGPTFPRGAGRRWRPDPIQTLLATGFLVVLGVTLVILIQNILFAAR